MIIFREKDNCIFSNDEKGKRIIEKFNSIVLKKDDSYIKRFYKDIFFDVLKERNTIFTFIEE